MITVVVSVLLLTALVGLFWRNDRKTSGLPHAPFGSDAPDRDLDRVMRDVDATRAHDPAFS